MAKKKAYGKRADLALDTFMKLARAYATVNQLEAAQIRSTYGLTQPQFGVIEALGHLGPLPLGLLSRKRLTSDGNTTVVVDNLEKEGLVQRRPNPEDRRVVIAQLTPKGRRLFERIFAQHAEYLTGMLAVLSGAEQEQLGKLLKKLGLALQERG